MPTFLCFLNWTDQGAKNAKDANKRYQASRSMAEKLGGKLLSAYVTTGQYDVALTLEMAIFTLCHENRGLDPMRTICAPSCANARNAGAKS